MKSNSAIQFGNALLQISLTGLRSPPGRPEIAVCQGPLRRRRGQCDGPLRGPAEASLVWPPSHFCREHQKRPHSLQADPCAASSRAQPPDCPSHRKWGSLSSPQELGPRVHGCRGYNQRRFGRMSFFNLKRMTMHMLHGSRIPGAGCPPNRLSPVMMSFSSCCFCPCSWC